MDDYLSGDRGADILFGGRGADKFAFGPNGGADWIADFNIAEGDKIVLPTGTAYTIGNYASQIVITLETGETIGIVGVSSSQLPGQVADWLTFA